MLKHVLNAWLMLAICMLASGCNAAPSTWMGANVKVSANAPWKATRQRNR